MNGIGMIEIKEAYAFLLEGEKSCVSVMLQTLDACQMTTLDSLHHQFYLTLERVNWAKGSPVAEELKALVPLTINWELTPLGRQQLPAFFWRSMLEKCLKK
jgi:hypothetical protein